MGFLSQLGFEDDATLAADLVEPTNVSDTVRKTSQKSELRVNEKTML